MLGRVAGGELAAQGDVALEVGREGGPVALGPRALPDGQRLGRGQRDRRRQVARARGGRARRRGAATRRRSAADVVRGQLALGPGRELVEELEQPVVGRALVRQARERRQDLAARLRRRRAASSSAGPSPAGDRRPLRSSSSATRANSAAHRAWTSGGASGTSGDGMLDAPQALDLDAHDVAGGQEPRRVERHADAARRPGQDQVAGQQRDRLGQEGDELRDRRTRGRSCARPGAARR